MGLAGPRASGEEDSKAGEGAVAASSKVTRVEGEAAGGEGEGGDEERALDQLVWRFMYDIIMIPAKLCRSTNGKKSSPITFFPDMHVICAGT